MNNEEEGKDIQNNQKNEEEHKGNLENNINNGEKSVENQNENIYKENIDNREFTRTNMHYN